MDLVCRDFYVDSKYATFTVLGETELNVKAKVFVFLQSPYV